MKKVLSIIATSSLIGLTVGAAINGAEYAQAKTEIDAVNAQTEAFAAKYEDRLAKFEHEKVENFECNHDEQEITFTWDTPDVEGDVEYNLQWSVFEDKGSFERVDGGGIRTSDTEFVYDFATLGDMSVGDYQSIFFYVDTVIDGQVRPASVSANVVHVQNFADTHFFVEHCE